MPDKIFLEEKFSIKDIKQGASKTNISDCWCSKVNVPSFSTILVKA